MDPSGEETLEKSAQQADTAKPKASLWMHLRCYFIFAPLVCLYTAVLGTISVLISSFDKSGRRQHGLARLWSKLILKTCLSPVEVVGLDRIDLSRPHVFCANHISAMDIPILYASLPIQFRILAKIELFKVPFIGWHLRHSGQIPVDQSNVRASVRSLSRAVETIHAGTPLVIFPEGGRSPSGQITPFMGGPFYIAIKSQIDIVPMAIVHSYEMLPMNSRLVHPQQLKLIVGEPVSPQGYTLKQTDQLAAKVQQIIEDIYYAEAQVADPRSGSTPTTIQATPSASQVLQ
jgi:1-acyl-sn-glycerol-3-phosphate acyltransferase